MKAIRINTVIDPSILPFEEVKAYKGRKAEVIILVEDTEVEKDDSKYLAAGSLNKYADTNKVAEEKTAYSKHIKEKYGNR
ncbi:MULTISPECIES: hypothetical protein [unclassified Carboxylicivirga]|uniref:hypothetical protein n=1 Tax=Carboxylicivirga TaxID=1628153 RepID=UPI003D351505